LCLIYWCFRWSRQSLKDGEDTHKILWGYQAIFSGAGLMIFAGIPFWVTGIPLWLDFPWDRTTLPFIPGACLVLVGLVDVLLEPKFSQPGIGRDDWIIFWNPLPKQS